MSKRRALPRTTAHALTLLLALAPAAWPASPAPAAIDAHVEATMAAFEVPGLALAIVKDGAVVTARGYGRRRLGDPAPVDARTLFGIASNTKVFTAMALGLLVEEGRIEWDAPVVRYLPWFQMWDPWVTRELTVRDLLVHRSGLGLGAGDLLWWPPSTYTRREVAERLRFIRPATSFRSAYAYDNVLYIVAGELIEAVSGRSWEDFVRTRILEKVGMAGSNAFHSAAAARGNVATPHARVEGTVRPISPFLSDVTNAAGGINSSAEDLARWLGVLLAEGRLPDGSRLASEATVRELARPVTPLPERDLPSELAPLRPQFAAYALGLNVRDYRGRRLLMHGGSLPGYVSRVVLVPELELGVAVLTNQESDPACDAIAFHVVDHYLGPPRTPWLEAFRTVAGRQRAEIEASGQKAAAARDAPSTPSLPRARYAGTYRDEWYGDVAIADEAGRLVMRFTRTPGLVGDLEHWQHDTFVVRWRDRELRADAFVTFALTPDGTVDHAKMRAVSPETDFSYDFHDLLLRPAPATPAAAARAGSRP